MKTVMNLFPLRSSIKTSFIIVVLSTLLLFTGCKKNLREVNDPALDSQSKSSHLTPNLKSVDIRLIADNLVSPIGVIAVPDNSKRLFILDQIGKVWILDSMG